MSNAITDPWRREEPVIALTRAQYERLLRQQYEAGMAAGIRAIWDCLGEVRAVIARERRWPTPGEVRAIVEAHVQ